MAFPERRTVDVLLTILLVPGCARPSYRVPTSESCGAQYPHAGFGALSFQLRAQGACLQSH